MLAKKILVIFCFILLHHLILVAQPSVSVPENLDISAAHPRLLIDVRDFASMKKSIASGTTTALGKMHDTYMAYAEACVNQAHKFEFLKSASGRLLPISRKALGELAACSYAYRYSGNKKFLDRAVTVLQEVCAFPSWNPRHYLDVAEMALGVSIAYDWLYKKLPTATRKECERAIQAYYFDTAQDPTYSRLFQNKNNWCQVLNGSLVSASIAFYDLNPAQSKSLIRRAVEDLQPAMELLYAPDGIFPEGPMYWGYGTAYQIVCMEALSGVYGTDFNLSEAKGFKESAQFILFSVGNFGKAYNYSDSGERRESVPALWYFARRFEEPDVVYRESSNLLSNGKYKLDDRLGFLYIYEASRCHAENMNEPARRLFAGEGACPLVLARSGWGKDDIYLGAKGGKASSGHGHMDAGSFVYEDRGFRWVREAPIPGYERVENLIKSLGGSLWKLGQQSLRWKMYGYNNAQHSTLTLNGHDLDCSGMATLVEQIDSCGKRGGTFDLSAVYAQDAKSVVRTLCIVDDKYLEVTDCISAPDTADVQVRWNLVTDAAVEETPEGIVLSHNNKRMLLHAEGYPVSYTTSLQMPANVPEEFMQFYEKAQRCAAFTFTVPAAGEMTITTTLKRL